MEIKIGEKLQSIREDRKMSQSDFADILSMTQSAYSRLESGQTHVSYEEIIRYAEILDVPVYELLPETSIFHLSNSGQGAGVSFFGNCTVHIGADAITKALEEKIHQLEKQIEVLKKRE